MEQHLSGKEHKKRFQAVLHQQVVPPAHLRELDYERWWCAACNNAVNSAIAMVRHCTGRAHERAVLLLHKMNDTYSLTDLEDAMTRAKDSFTRNGGDMMEFPHLPDTHLMPAPVQLARHQEASSRAAVAAAVGVARPMWGAGGSDDPDTLRTSNPIVPGSRTRSPSRSRNHSRDRRRSRSRSRSRSRDNRKSRNVAAAAGPGANATAFAARAAAAAAVALAAAVARAAAAALAAAAAAALRSRVAHAAVAACAPATTGTAVSSDDAVAAGAEGRASAAPVRLPL